MSAARLAARRTPARGPAARAQLACGWPRPPGAPWRRAPCAAGACSREQRPAPPGALTHLSTHSTRRRSASSPATSGCALRRPPAGRGRSMLSAVEQSPAPALLWQRHQRGRKARANGPSPRHDFASALLSALTHVGATALVREQLQLRSALVAPRCWLVALPPCWRRAQLAAADVPGRTQRMGRRAAGGVQSWQRARKRLRARR